MSSTPSRRLFPSLGGLRCRGDPRDRVCVCVFFELDGDGDGDGE
jgi:hypothetical protein